MQSTTARAAGYAPGSARNAGYRLLRDPLIAIRIAEIQREMAHSHCLDVDVLLGKLENIYRRAVDDHHFSAATRAVELQARLAGVGGSPAPSLRSKRPSPAAAVPSKCDEAAEAEEVAEAGTSADRASS